ncbi:MAG: DUF4347 domain-containing protein [Lyngbya sp.]|nr:DUF4347 domain-containing protein [Lyngbya sp.]
MLLNNFNRQVPVSGQGTVIILDTGVTDYLRLLRGISSDSEIILLDSTQNGIEQITQTLRHYKNIQSLHIVSHGNKGCLVLGNQLLNINTLETHASTIQQWRTALAENGEILLYGCHVATGEEGIRFVRRLAELTQANIAASNSLTGNAALGGNWQLEFHTQPIKTPLVFNREILQTYSGVFILLVDESFANSTLSPQPFTDELKWIFGSDQSVNDPNDLESPFLTARPFREPEPGGIVGVPEGENVDAEGQGTLRFTSNANDQASFIIYDFPVRSDAGLELKFDYFAYGGSGADGISFFLIDGEASPQRSGGFGGSLGYAPRTDQNIPGLVGGYVGIGFDEFGNFANAQDKGVSNDGSPGRTPNAITVRGSDENNYQFLTTTGRLNNFSLDTRDTTNRELATRTVQILLTQEGLLSVAIDLNENGEIEENETLISEFDVQQENGGEFPSNFKFGFAGSTGNSTNFHEIRNVQVRTLEEPPVLDLEGITPNIVDFETTFTQGQEPVAIADSTVIEDADDENIQQAIITLTNVLDNGEESLSLNEVAEAIVNQFSLNIIGNGTNEIIIEGAASREDYATIIDNIVYNNTADNPTLTPREVEVFVRDKLAEEGFDSNLAVTTININPGTIDNEPATLDLDTTETGNNYQTTFTRGGDPVIVGNVGNIDITDVDNTTVASVTLTLRNSLNGNNETLAINGTLPAGITASNYNPETGVLILSGIASLADYETAIGQVIYNNTAENPDLTDRQIEVIVNDGTEDSIPAIATISINDPVEPNIPPVADNITNSELVENSVNIPLQPLQGTDSDGEIVSFRITQLPANSQLFLNGILLDITQEIPLNQAGNLSLTPDSDFVGTVQFQYTAIDNNGDEDLTPATFTIPVISENIPENIPPVADNITNPEIVENSVNIPLEPLQGTDSDGEIVSFRITQLPGNSQLFLNGVLLNNTTQEIPLNQAGNLSLTPDSDFVGTVQFQYTAIDNNGDEDLTPATFTIPVVPETIPENIPPETAEISASPLANNVTQASLPALTGSDTDGSVTGFIITQLPTDGELFLNGVAVEVNQQIPVSQATQLTFTPNSNFVGETTFQYAAIDDQETVDPTPAVYTIPIFQPNLPPTAESLTTPAIKNTRSQVSLPSLNANDEDGIVETFTIRELPTGGELFVNGEAVQNNQPISINQANQLTFTPDQNFVGESQFSFIVTDDDGATSNLATVTIPVFANQPPTATSVATQPFLNNRVNVAFPSLIASDVDGIIEEFSLVNLPLFNQGKIFLDGIEVTNISQVQQLTVSQISSLSFTPNSSFVGNLELGYFAIDNDGESSNLATITFPVITEQVPLNPNLPPIAENLSLFDLNNDGSRISIPRLTATDPDGQVVSFSLNRLPSTGQLFLNETPITTLSQVQELTLEQASQLTYIPNSGFLGTVTFTYQATDNDNAISNTATITLEINDSSIPRDDDNDDNIDDICGCVPLPTLEPILLPEPQNLPLISFDSISISQQGTENDDLLFGSDESERIVGLGGNDGIFSQAGNDSLEGNSGNDFLQGGIGDDLVDGGSENDVLWGWFGEDTLQGDSGNDTIFGGTNDLSIPDLNGRDWLIAGEGDDFIQGNEGNDFISSGEGNDLAFGGKDDDQISGNLGNDTLFGNLGNDTLIADQGEENLQDQANNFDMLYGNQGNDLLQGSLGRDTIYTGKGDDFAYGGKDNDLLRGELGNDTLLGDLGEDTLFGDTNDPNSTQLEGEDWLWGGMGNDRIYGNRNNDTLNGGEDNDQIYGGKEDDLLFGEAGNDQLFGDLGNDTLCGNDGNDTLFGDIKANSLAENNSSQDKLNGGDGDDFLSGNDGEDQLCGQTGNDTLYGGQGDDTLVGGEGEDLLFGDLGNDTLVGGLGRDGFILSLNRSTDTIFDFTDGEDYLGLIGGLTFSDLTIEAGENETFIRVETQLIAILRGVEENLITAEDFLEVSSS